MCNTHPFHNYGLANLPRNYTHRTLLCLHSFHCSGMDLGNTHLCLWLNEKRNIHRCKQTKCDIEGQHGFLHFES